MTVDLLARTWSETDCSSARYLEQANHVLR